MPMALLQSMNRRTFLRASVLSSTALLMHPSATAAPDRLHLALLSDTHIPADRLPGARGFNACEHLSSIVSDLVGTGADGLVIAGDAAQLTGEPDDYVVLLDLLKPVIEAMPVYIALGNHDNRENFHAAVSSQPGERAQVEDKHVTIIEHRDIRIVLLDSLFYVRQKGGLLGKVQREWLSAYLQEHSDRPVVLVFHHTLGDGDNDLLDGERMLRLAHSHSHVKLLIHGHSHRWQIYDHDGLPIVNLPTSAHIWTPDQPIGWVDADFRRDGATLTLHAFAGNREQDGKSFDFSWR
ncbi:MAG: hypothetical protein AMXMBFR84_44270 [Candidatus Hydrogenedentota bacterium]